MIKSPVKLSIKSTLLALAFIFSLLNLSKAQDGIYFSEGNWNEILAKAKAKETLVFVDAYTTWCGPCKMMDKNVFSQQEVGNFYNEHFINAKIDMEKGEGIQLAMQYNVRAYPSYLFVDAGGTLVHRAVGYYPVEDFIKVGETALDPENWLSSMALRYATGDREPQFLYKYAISAYRSMDEMAPEIAKAYLKTQSDWANDQNREMVVMLAEKTDSEYFTYLLENRSAFNQQFGEGQMMEKILGTIYYENIENPDQQKALQSAEQFIRKAFGDEAEKYVSIFKMSFYQSLGDMENYAKAAVEYYTQDPLENANDLNNEAWIFYEAVEDKKMLKTAVKWAKKSVKLDNQHYNNDTLAHLYYKLGKKGKAKKAAKRAIELGMESGEDYSSTKELLDKLNS